MSFYLPGFENFCQILLQRPFAWRSAGMLFTLGVTGEDLTIMTKLAKEHFKKVTITLKQLLRSMLLVFRCGKFYFISKLVLAADIFCTFSC